MMYDEVASPTGAYQTILATNEQIAETVIPDPRVRGVSVTGSERAGAAVAEVAGRNLKKVVLEMGGSDPFILLAPRTSTRSWGSRPTARLDNTGQSCNAAKRFIVADDLYDDFLAKLTEKMRATEPGDPDSRTRPWGRSRRRPRRTASRTSSTARWRRAPRWSLDGERRDDYFGPTILAGISPDSDAYREEFFGPVASVYRVGSEEEAVTVANDTPFGLGSYVFTTDSDQADRVGEQARPGMVFINGVIARRRRAAIRRRQALGLRPRARPATAWRSSSTRS